MARGDELLAALTSAQGGIAGITGSPRGRTWDAVVSAHAPELTGESVTFTALGDGTLVVEQDVPDNSLAPVADAIEQMLPPPYRAAAAKNEGDVWTAVAESVHIVVLAGVEADEIELTVVDGERTLTVGDEQTIRALPALDALADEHDSVALHAERVDGDLYAVDVFPL
jgi:hypothetical protein